MLIPKTASLVCLILFPAFLWAQGGAPSWSSGFGPRGVSGPVSAVGVHDDGTGAAIYVAGNFATAGSVAADDIARFDGVSWSTVGSGWTGLDSYATSMATFDDGSGPVLYVGGTFWSGGMSYGLARWDGTTWSLLGAMTTTAHYWYVTSVAVFDDGTGPALYVGGTFAAIGGLLAPGLARWNGTSWSTVGGALTWTFAAPQVLALLVHDDGSGSALFAAGRFDAAGATVLNGIGRWNGAAWSGLGIGISSWNAVAALAEFDDGGGPKLYAGGAFSEAGGLIANGLARWDGSNWSAVGGGVGSGFIESMVSWTDGTGPALYLTGTFLSAGGSTGFNGIARWDGTSFTPLGSGIDGAGVSLTTFLHTSTSYLVCGGVFQSAGSTGARGVALWNGLAWESMGGQMANPPGAPVLYTWDDGSGPVLHAGGSFQTSSPFPIGAARSNGTSWSSFHTGLAPTTPAFPSSIRDLLSFDDGTGAKLFAAGRFFFPPSSGFGPTGFASWNGSTWTSASFQFQEGTALAVHDDGTGAALYGAGITAGGAGVFKWTGANWALMGVFWSVWPGTVVRTLVSFDDGTGPALYAGGDFTSIGNVSVSAIARWNGATWSPVGGGMAASGFDPRVRALHVHDDGNGPRLFATGRFHRSGLASTRHIAAWDGSAWQGLGGGLGGTVHGGDPYLEGNVLMSWDDGSGSALYVGGRFLTAGGVQAAAIARWDGATWNPLGSGLLGQVHEGSVEGLAAFSDASGSSLFCSGDIRISGGLVAEGIARWTSHAPALFLDQPLGAGTGVVVRNTGLDQGVEVFNVFSLDPCVLGPGNGPYLGLCAANPALLANQILMPPGSFPFHYFASTGTATFGPFTVPTGLTIEGVCVKALGATITGVSPVRRFTTQ